MPASNDAINDFEKAFNDYAKSYHADVKKYEADKQWFQFWKKIEPSEATKKLKHYSSSGPMKLK